LDQNPQAKLDDLITQVDIRPEVIGNGLNALDIQAASSLEMGVNAGIDEDLASFKL
jgi:hypothetical protein